MKAQNKIITMQFDPITLLLSVLWWKDDSLVHTLNIFWVRITLGVNLLSHCGFWKRNVGYLSDIFFIVLVTFTSNILTTDNVQGTQGHVIKAVKWTHPCLLLQLLHQDLRLLVHHFQELWQDGEVEGGGQHLPPLTPLRASADQKKKTTRRVKGLGRTTSYLHILIYILKWRYRMKPNDRSGNDELSVKMFPLTF